MKKLTQKLLNKKTTGRATFENIESNALKAFKKLDIPRKLWTELSMKYAESKFKDNEMRNEIPVSCLLNTNFMLEFAIGWIEKNRKFK